MTPAERKERYRARCREQESERRARLADAGFSVPSRPKTSAQIRRETIRQRQADRVDGYDRDDLGLSPDY